MPVSDSLMYKTASEFGVKNALSGNVVLSCDSTDVVSLAGHLQAGVYVVRTSASGLTTGDFTQDPFENLTGTTYGTWSDYATWSSSGVTTISTPMTDGSIAGGWTVQKDGIYRLTMTGTANSDTHANANLALIVSVSEGANATATHQIYVRDYGTNVNNPVGCAGSWTGFIPKDSTVQFVHYWNNSGGAGSNANVFQLAMSFGLLREVSTSYTAGTVSLT